MEKKTKDSIIEFLVVYGWAIIIVIVAVIALIYIDYTGLLGD